MSAVNGRASRVYVDGVFDLFHTSHLSFLRRARGIGGQGAVLIVGVISDEAARWKRKTIVPHAQRVEMLRCCRLADEVVEDPPLTITEEFLDAHEITHVVHGDDDLQEEFFRVPLAREIMSYVPYTRDGPFAVSTTGLIERIRERPVEQ